MIHVELGYVKMDETGETLATEAAVAMASVVAEAAKVSAANFFPVNEIAEIMLSSSIMGVARLLEKEYGIHVDLEEIAKDIIEEGEDGSDHRGLD